MRAECGTYLLVLRSHGEATVQVGRWGPLAVRPGVYLYVGSAFGPGGVRARVGRHLRMRKKPHWHLDYLRPLTKPLAVWISYAPERLECRWAQGLADRPELNPIAGFGSSDCRCVGHLFATAVPPEPALFSQLAGSPAQILLNLG